MPLPSSCIVRETECHQTWRARDHGRQRNRRRPTGVLMSRSGSAEAAPVFSRELKMIGLAVVLGAVMSILDTTIVNVALRTLAEDFDAPLSSIQWVATGYTLALAS